MKKKDVFQHRKEKQLVANKTLSELEICIDLQLWLTTNCFPFRYGNLEIGHILIDVNKPRHCATSVISSWFAIAISIYSDY